MRFRSGADHPAVEVEPSKKVGVVAAALLHALAVCQQFSAAVLFGFVFSSCHEGQGSARLFAVDAAILAAGLAMPLLGRQARTGRRRRLPLRVVAGRSRNSSAEEAGAENNYVGSRAFLLFLFVVLVRMATPMLRTLTDSYSTDTIYALATALAVVHVVTHDYGNLDELGTVPLGSGNIIREEGIEEEEDWQGKKEKEKGKEEEEEELSRPVPLSGILSSNAAMFGCVLLASRLPSDDQVFGLLLLAVELFALLPLARRGLATRCCSSRKSGASFVVVHVGASCLFAAATALGLRLVSFDWWAITTKTTRG